MDRDGNVAVVRHDSYHVEWYSSGGSPIIGAPVTYEPVPISEAEKEAWLKAMRGGTMTITDRGGTRTVRPPPPKADDMEWPTVLPPFTGNPRISPEGELWIQRSTPATAKGSRFDVFDRNGRLVRQVELAEGRGLVGLRRGALYAVRTDEDGLRWLEKFKK